MVIEAAKVKVWAAKLGFAACGLARAGRVSAEREAEVRQWIACKRHAGMDYLEKHMELRFDPRLILEGARTVVSLAINYYSGEAAPGGFHMARYAYGKDYHDVVRLRLQILLQRILAETETTVGSTPGRVCVDTAPMDERYWAMQAGIGWPGRNGLLIVPKVGSFCFLGEILLQAEADMYDAPARVRCGACRRCVEACPTGALRDDGTMDAARCLSYLTIENRDDIPPTFRATMGNCIYGCDRCAEACPHNRHPRPTTEADFLPSEDLQKMTEEDWQHLTEEDYRRLFKGSAVKRAKYTGLMRNIRAVSQPEQPPRAPLSPDAQT